MTAAMIQAVSELVNKITNKGERGCLTTYHAVPIIRRFISRRMLRKGIVILPEEKTQTHSMRCRPFHAILVAPVTKRSKEPVQPSQNLCARVENELTSWEECFTKHVVEALRKAIGHAECDKSSLIKGFKGHRRSFTSGEKGEIRLGLEDYSSPVREAIEAGFKISIDEDGKPKVLRSGKLSQNRYGFGARRRAGEARRAGWNDE